MLIFQGSACLPSAQLRRRLLRLFPDKAPETYLQLSTLVFIEAKEEDLQDPEKLYALLGVNLPFELAQLEKDFVFMITPRFGTRSSWSTKASELVHQAGWRPLFRVERGCCYEVNPLFWVSLDFSERLSLQGALYDPLTESLWTHPQGIHTLFEKTIPEPMQIIAFRKEGKPALERANLSMGLALSDPEIDFLEGVYERLERDPTDAELMMFAQINSEHCRHKIFNAVHQLDGKVLPQSLFSMIRHTHVAHPDQALVAYKDNAAVLKGPVVESFGKDPVSQVYRWKQETIHAVLKVETHNHPTAISPFEGSATGAGGEIRDEAATGRGAMTQVGLCGFSVSHLLIPGYSMPWEFCLPQSPAIASSLEIMLEGPLGAASFNNEFGRPNLCGYFRTFSLAISTDYGESLWGYHKPIMIAGGVGQIRTEQVEKQAVSDGCLLLVLGGPALPIGLGGGAASSRAQGEGVGDLDFSSVQRSNPEMQRRCQEVINACWSMGKKNPIISIHDVGAGGLSNALPELVALDDLGACIFLRCIPTDAPGMSPLALWCNEAQERYVLAIAEEDLPKFDLIAKREACPYAVVGKTTVSRDLVVVDDHFGDEPVHLSLEDIFEKAPPLQRTLSEKHLQTAAFNRERVDFQEAVERVLQFPAVADKRFLITIADRSVTGLVARDQMIGPWQVPVSDVAVVANTYSGFTGEAMAMGERAPIAILHPAASARMAVGEAITNLAAASIDSMHSISLSANWMAAADYPGEGLALYEAVQAIGLELCPALGIAIPVGKDSLSMRSQWHQGDTYYSVTSPLSLVITAAAPVQDIRKTVTPMLRRDQGETCLILLDLGEGANSLGGSCLAQVYGEIGQRPPDLDEPQLLVAFFSAIQRLNQQGLLLAYHDRSDGGLFVTLVEMMLAGHCGVSLNVERLGEDLLSLLFSEELGAVIQVRQADQETVWAILREQGLGHLSHECARLNERDQCEVYRGESLIYSAKRLDLQRLWSSTSYRLQALRDNPETAQAEYEDLLRENQQGIAVDVRFDWSETTVPYVHKHIKPRAAILREQGINGHVEMAAAFVRAGFEAVDVHMNDLVSGTFDLSTFQVMAACGGFSYGDVLGAGSGWAARILHVPRLHDQFARFFERDQSLTLGVCNGCQMLSQLNSLIPGAALWPRFLTNHSQRFEARFVSVRVSDSTSLWFSGMQGSVIPVVTAHGEGRVDLGASELRSLHAVKGVTLQYVDDRGEITEAYPYNPNGSVEGVTGLTTADGRVSILMPHPERVVRTAMNSWHPDGWGEEGPWMRLFRNARQWLH